MNTLIVIVISRLLKRYLKAKRTRAPTYSRALRWIKWGFAKRVVKWSSGPMSSILLHIAMFPPLLSKIEGSDVKMWIKWFRQVSADTVIVHCPSVVGLLQFLGMFLFATFVSDALGDQEIQPRYNYDWGSINAVIAFATTNLTAVLTVYSYRGRHQLDEKKKKASSSSLPIASMDLSKVYGQPQTP